MTELDEYKEACVYWEGRALAAEEKAASLLGATLALEARLAEAVEVIKRDVEALTDADTQIEYLHDKFKPTGSGMNAIARIDMASTAARAFLDKDLPTAEEVRGILAPVSKSATEGTK